MILNNKYHTEAQRQLALIQNTAYSLSPKTVKTKLTEQEITEKLNNPKLDLTDKRW